MEISNNIDWQSWATVIKGMTSNVKKNIQNESQSTPRDAPTKDIRIQHNYNVPGMQRGGKNIHTHAPIPNPHKSGMETGPPEDVIRCRGYHYPHNMSTLITI